MTCPSCSAEVPAGARFCPSCGHALLVPTDERRIVTVLFGDLVGFTTLSEARDPEQVKNLVDRCFEALAADITSYGGRVDKIVGDAVVALFGAPTAHEDDAERAVRAALQMQRTLAATAADIGVQVQMRIGVNTGEVLVGAIRAGGDYTAMGDVVNTASRLQAAAGPGQVVVGPETHAATSDVFRYEPLGELQAKGREAPVAAWAAVEAVTAPGRRRRRHESPLVGRDAEASLLESAMQTAFAYRRPHLVLLVGEAGIGKSRLAEHVVQRSAIEHEAAVLLGRTLPYGEANVWWPLAEAVRSVCGIRVEDTAADARAKCVGTVAAVLGEAAESPDATRTADALLYLMGYGGRLSDVDPARARDEATRAMRLLLEGLSAEMPVILTIADVQWADPLVLELVDHLLERLHRLPLVIFLTARPELESRWRPTPGRHNLVVLNLDPLDEKAASDLLTALLGQEPEPELRDELVERSGGNPFFLEELVALLADRTHGRLAPGAVPGLPATLRGLVAARLDSLFPDERDVLEDASVVGRNGPLAAIDALAGRQVGKVVERLVGRDLLVVDGETFEFRSDLVREVAYGTLTKADRARRHAALAAWTEGLASEKARGDEVLDLVASHWSTAAELARELGGDVDGVPADALEQALDALERAAERAEERELHGQAQLLFDQILRLLGGEPSGRRRHALIGRARANTAHRHLDLAAADLDLVEAEAIEVGDELALARALTVRGDLLRAQGELVASLEVLGRAVELWRRLGDRRGEASALRRTGMSHLFANDNDAAEPYVVEALAAFQEIGSRRGIAWAHQNLAWIAFNRGESDAAEERLRDSIDMFADIGDWGGLSWALGLLAWVLYARGRGGEAESLAERVLVEAGDQGDRWATGMMGVLLGSIRLWRGRTEEAYDALQSAAATLDEVGDPWARVRARGPLARVLASLGRMDEAFDAIEECRSLGATTPGELDMGAVLGAEVAIHAGDGETARRLLEPLELPGDGGFGFVEVAVSMALAHAQTGDPAAGVSILKPVVGLVRDLGPQANARSALALTLAAAGRPEEARPIAVEVLAMEAATYVDRITAAMAEACAAARLDDRGGAQAAVDLASSIVGATGDRLTAAVVALARARVLQAIDDPDASVAADDAAGRFAAIGVTPTGWDLLLAQATGAGAATPAG